VNSPFEYIEDYFTGRLGEEEKKIFEQRCVDDTTFADDVAFYIAKRQVIRDELLRQKLPVWTDGGKTPGRNTRILRWPVYAAAASVLLALALVYLLNSPSSPHRLAEAWMKNNYTRLSLTMNASADSLQQGIIAYNNNDYNKALTLFESLYRSDPRNNDALKFSGIVYLRTQRYDKALERFGQLADAKGLLSNPGAFLQAVTLLERDAPGDRQRAHELLQSVVRQQLAGSKEAAEWLKKF
jgi:tetratricopeptide (TPR) repeat protein